RSERRTYDAGIFPDPADARMPGVDAFLHGTGIDVALRLERQGRSFAHPLEETIEPLLDDAVVIIPPRVTGDMRPERIGAFGRVRTIDVVNGRGDDNRARLGKNLPHVAAPVRRTAQIIHAAGVPAIDPVAKKSELGKISCRRDSARIESK